MRGIFDKSIPCTSWNSVLMTPGRQTWTRTPVSVSSFGERLRERDQEGLGARVDRAFREEGIRRRAGERQQRETLMTPPRFRSTIPGSTARVTCTTARMWMETSASATFGSSSTKRR